MISPLNIATDGYLCHTLGVSTNGYICIIGDQVFVCDESRFNAKYFYNLGYSIKEVVIVKPKDIMIANDGTGGVLLSYNTGKENFCIGIPNIDATEKSRDEIICDFVSFLNAKPVLNPRVRRKK